MKDHPEKQFEGHMDEGRIENPSYIESWYKKQREEYEQVLHAESHFEQEVSSDEDNPFAVIMESLTRRFVEKALNRLFPRERSCLLLYIIAQFEPNEIAEIMDISEKQTHEAIKQGREGILRTYYLDLEQAQILPAGQLRTATENDDARIAALLQTITTVERVSPAQITSGIESEPILQHIDFPLHSNIQGFQNRSDQDYNSDELIKSGVNSTSYLEEYEIVSAHKSSYIGVGQLCWKYNPDKPIRLSPDSTSYIATYEDVPGQRGIITFFHVTGEAKEEILLRVRRVNETIHLHTDAHPHIAKIVDYGVEDEEPYVVEEYIDGVPLRETYSKQNKMLPNVALSLCRQMVSALQFMHTDICHLGMCSLRILEKRQTPVENQASPAPAQEPLFVLTGWKFDRPVAETYALEDGPYLAPEMFDAATFGQPGELSDSYALAVILYEALTGELPLGQADDGRYRMTHLHGLERPSVKALPRPLRRVFLKALSKQQGERYQHIYELLEDFEKACQSIPASPLDGKSSVVTMLQGINRPITRRKAMGVGIAVAASLLGIWGADQKIHLHRVSGNTRKPISNIGDLLLWFDKHQSTVNAALPSPDGSKILSGDASGRLMVWSSSSGQMYLDNPVAHMGVSIVDVTWSPNSRFFATVDDTGLVVLWSMQSGRFDSYRLSGRGSAVAWSPLGDHLIVASDNLVWVFDDVLTSNFGQQDANYAGHSSRVNCLAISPDSESVVSASNDKTAQIWLIETATREYTYRGHSKEIFTVVYSPDGGVIASGGGDNSVQIWDAMNPTGDILFTYNHDAPVRTVAFSPDSRSIASGGDDNMVRLYNINGDGYGTLDYIYTGHKENVLSVAWLNEKSIVSAGGKEVHIWRARL